MRAGLLRSGGGCRVPVTSERLPAAGRGKHEGRKLCCHHHHHFASVLCRRSCCLAPAFSPFSSKGKLGARWPAEYLSAVLPPAGHLLLLPCPGGGSPSKGGMKWTMEWIVAGARTCGRCVDEGDASGGRAWNCSHGTGLLKASTVPLTSRWLRVQVGLRELTGSVLSLPLASKLTLPDGEVTGSRWET